MKIHWDIVQGSEEWFKLRCGRITGSVADTFLVNGRSENGFGAGAMTELYRIVEEQLTGEPRITFSGNSATEWGNENEDRAIAFYENSRFITVKSAGFIEKNKYVGASPDGMMPDIKKGLEVKCRPKNHLELVDKGEYYDKDYIQCQFNLWCSGYESWDLIYFHPNLPQKSKSKVFTFKPDKKLFDTFEERTSKFIEMIESRIKNLK